MNPEESSSSRTAAAREGLELVSTALSLVAGALLLYRIANPTGPEPLELIRDTWRAGRGRVQEWRQYRRAMQDTLARIRDLPETEGSS